MFVGREAERAELVHVLEPDGPLVLFITGTGGIGKTALLDAFAAEHARRLLVDCGVREPDAPTLLRFASGHPLALTIGAGAAMQQPLAPIADSAFPAVIDALTERYLRHLEPAVRAELIEVVWGTTYTGGSNVVDAVVRTLRRKLGDRAATIETVRGVGYRYRP